VRARLENRAESGVASQGFFRVPALGVLVDDGARTLVDGARQKRAAPAALFEEDPGERRQIDSAQHHDRKADDRSDTRDLLGFDAPPPGGLFGGDPASGGVFSPPFFHGKAVSVFWEGFQG